MRTGFSNFVRNTEGSEIRQFGEMRQNFQISLIFFIDHALGKSLGDAEGLSVASPLSAADNCAAVTTGISLIRVFASEFSFPV